MRRPRHVSAEERALWDLVARRMKPIAPVAHPLTVPAAKPKPARPAVSDPIPDFRIGQRAMPEPPKNLRTQTAPLNMDAKSFGKLKRGKLLPEGRIDLHGMTLAQAHPALIGFILSAHGASKRLVLVITGKGRDSDGILRRQVPLWLNMAPLGPLVLQIAPAHLRHGGQGALYVYLRRR
tara:strand:- start:159 stop:695 length:537 start_codon:yes stop_codon:yes gene_type:complete